MPDDPIQRHGLAPRFWERPLKSLNPAEWEALCDGCGKCCLNKLEDEDSGQVVFTRVACRLLDGESCHCGQYDIRRQFVPECVMLTPKTYKLRHEGKALHDWHPLISGDPESVHRAGQSVRGWTIPEFEVAEEDWEDYAIEGDL